MEDFGLSESQITVIYNGIDSEKFHPLPESERLALRQTYQIPAAAKCLVYVGSGFERKGLAAAIMAVSRNDAYLLVVGQDKAEKNIDSWQHPWVVRIASVLRVCRNRHCRFIR
ncbi:glycosyltransferase, GG-Bacteroidales peptide system [Morganella morganii]|nr:glycosyltransferase, GG-Bacteroidales peptide system [Morganella morganii]